MLPPAEPQPDDPLDAREQECLDSLADLEAPLRVSVVPQNGVPVVRLEGELDVATAPMFRDCLTEQLGRSPAAMVIDLSGTSYIDSSGLAVIMRAARQMPGAVAVVSPRDRITRLFQATGLSQSVRLHRTVGEAMAALA